MLVEATETAGHGLGDWCEIRQEQVARQAVSRFPIPYFWGSHITGRDENSARGNDCSKCH